MIKRMQLPPAVSFSIFLLWPLAMSLPVASPPIATATIRSSPFFSSSEKDTLVPDRKTRTALKAIGRRAKATLKISHTVSLSTIPMALALQRAKYVRPMAELKTIRAIITFAIVFYTKLPPQNEQPLFAASLYLGFFSARFCYRQSSLSLTSAVSYEIRLCRQNGLSHFPP